MAKKKKSNVISVALKELRGRLKAVNEELTRFNETQHEALEDEEALLSTAIEALEGV